MHNLIQIILQSWQIAKNNKLLWLFSAGLSFSSVIGNLWGGNTPRDNAFLLCLQCTSIWLYLFMLIFGEYGLIYCSGAALQDVEIKFSQVWTSFKVNIFKLFLLGILIGMYFFGLFAMIFLFRQTLISLVGDIFDIAFLSDTATMTVSILLGGVIFLSSYGMIFQGMGAFQSFRNGFNIFFTGWTLFIGLSLLFEIPRLLADISTIITILGTGQTLNYANYRSMTGTFPYQWMTSVISFFINPVYFLSVLKIYLDLTTANNNGEISQTVVT
jgi:hypothetical protein